MSNFSNNATSVVWAYFRSQNNGMELSPGPDHLLFRNGAYLLTLHLESKSFSAQITNGVGFPKPREPKIFEIRGNADNPIIIGPDGVERTPKETFRLLDEFSLRTLNPSILQG